MASWSDFRRGPCDASAVPKPASENPRKPPWASSGKGRSLRPRATWDVRCPTPSNRPGARRWWTSATVGSAQAYGRVPSSPGLGSTWWRASWSLAWHRPSRRRLGRPARHRPRRRDASRGVGPLRGVATGPSRVRPGCAHGQRRRRDVRWANVPGDDRGLFRLAHDAPYEAEAGGHDQTRCAHVPRPKHVPALPGADPAVRYSGPRPPEPVRDRRGELRRTDRAAPGAAFVGADLRLAVFGMVATPAGSLSDLEAKQATPYRHAALCEPAWLVEHVVGVVPQRDYRTPVPLPDDAVRLRGTFPGEVAWMWALDGLSSAEAAGRWFAWTHVRGLCRWRRDRPPRRSSRRWSDVSEFRHGPVRVTTSAQGARPRRRFSPCGRGLTGMAPSHRLERRLTRKCSGAVGMVVAICRIPNGRLPRRAAIPTGAPWAPPPRLWCDRVSLYGHGPLAWPSLGRCARS